MGLFSGPSSEVGRATLDAGAQQIINEQERQAKLSEQQIADQNMAGAKEIGSQVINETPAKLQLGATALGEGYDPAMSQAIAQKAAKTHEREINQLQRQTELGARLQKNQQLQARAGIWQKEAVFKQNYSMKVLQAQVNKANARAQVIGSIGSALGSVAGMMIAGPAGAVVGGQLGSGAGGGQQATSQGSFQYAGGNSPGSMGTV